MMAGTQRTNPADIDNVTNILKNLNEQQILQYVDHPGELIDSICWKLFDRPMKTVIHDKYVISKDYVRTELEKYLGCPIKEFDTTLHPGNVSESGFLVKAQSIVDVIWTDSMYLQKVHVSRSQLADYIETAVLYNSIKSIKEMEKDYELSEATKQLLQNQELAISSLLDKHGLVLNTFAEYLDSNFVFQSVSYAHKQQDPFHPSLDNPSITASTEYFLLCIKHPLVTQEHTKLHSSQWPDGSYFRFSDLSLSLIRRFGFFQGPGVPHRLEPSELALYFGLLPL